MCPERTNERETYRSSGIRPVPLELYIHVPFCVKKCDYCDFLSFHAEPDTQQAYFDALLSEVRAWGARLKKESRRSYEVVSVFFGGGTPSLPDAGLIARVMQEVREQFTLAADAEISMEANPGTLTLEKLWIYRSCGINRLSIGLQSAHNRELALLGRIHTWEEFLQSYRLARAAGFVNVNIDLISALPGQSRESWLDTLHRTAGLSPEHISAYSLIVEEGTPFALQDLVLPDEETQVRMYEDTAKVLAEYGYEQYEISNYAKPGFACRHNLGYWKRTEYLGLGLGAASFRYVQQEELSDRERSVQEGGFYRYTNPAKLTEYLENSGFLEKLWKNMEPVSRREAMEEFLFLGLRMTAGISEEDYARCFGEPISVRYGTFLKKYEAAGFLHKDIGEDQQTRWRFTREGIQVSNRILADVLD